MNISAIQANKLATLQNPTKSVAVQAAAAQQAKQLSLKVSRNVEDKNLKIEDKAVISTKAQALLEQELSAQGKIDLKPNTGTTTGKNHIDHEGKIDPNTENAKDKNGKIGPYPNTGTATGKNHIDQEKIDPNTENAKDKNGKIGPYPNTGTATGKNHIDQEKIDPKPNTDTVQSQDNVSQNNKNIQTVKKLMGVLRARKAYA